MEANTNKSKEVIICGQKYLLEVSGDMNVSLKLVTPVPISDPDQPDVEPEQPQSDINPNDMGTIKKGPKWTAEPGSADTWKLVNMTNPSDQFKFVDSEDLNIIANIKTKERAEELRNWFKTHPLPTDHEENTDDDGTPDEQGSSSESVTGLDGPYKTTGKQIESNQRGPSKAHYASGKPDDHTIEKNCKKIPYPNHMMIVDITVPQEMDHDDNVSIKIGGRHKEEGWFDNGISIYDGQTCLGTEKKHPSTKLCIIKGKKYGDLRGKRLKIASTYFKDQNKTEFWVNLGNGWDNACEGKDVGGFNPGADEFETQLRIDGFIMEKTTIIHSAVVQEIDV
jgi:hypothetical protein